LVPTLGNLDLDFDVLVVDFGARAFRFAGVLANMECVTDEVSPPRSLAPLLVARVDRLVDMVVGTLETVLKCEFEGEGLGLLEEGPMSTLGSVCVT